jgi:hypothetical protein
MPVTVSKDLRVCTLPHQRIAQHRLACARECWAGDRRNRCGGK